MGDRFRRQSHRMPGWDYRRPGSYFITVCTRNREFYFDNPDVLEITHDYIHRLPNYFSHIEIDEYIIMPNHIHVIINITKWPYHMRGKITMAHDRRGETICAGSQSHNVSPLRSELGKINGPQKLRPNGTPSGSIGAVVGKMKSLVTRKSNYVLGKWKIVWQRDFWDHIIRNDTEYHRIVQYIKSNPEKWIQDRNNPKSQSYDPHDERTHARLDWAVT